MATELIPFADLDCLHWGLPRAESVAATNESPQPDAGDDASEGCE